MNVFSGENLEKLITAHGGDTEALGMIAECLESFSHYHSAIFKMETTMKIQRKSASSETYREMVSDMDGTRTTCHNALLARVNILNRMASNSGIEPIYAGTVSEEQPYRREVADAVLAYVENIVRDRL